MPFIHVTSLPFDPPLDTRLAVETVSKDFAADTGIALEHITVTWNYLAPGCQAVAGKTTDYQPENTHPVLVDLLVPDFNDAGTIERMLESAAAGISIHAKVDIKNIFINCRHAHSGMVFDAGQVVRW